MELSELLSTSLRRAVAAGGKRMTQRALAKELGMTEQTVSRWFRDETRPSDFNLDRLRRILNWSDEEYVAVRAPVPSIAASGTPVDSWRQLRSLPPEFPRLDPVGTSEDIGERRRRSLAEITQDITAATRLVVVPVGHGVTTLARALASIEKKECLLRSVVGTVWSIEDVLPTSHTHARESAWADMDRLHPLAVAGEWYEDAAWLDQQADSRSSALFEAVTPSRVRDALRASITNALTRSLATQEWERPLGRATLCRILGVEPETDLVRLRAELGTWVAGSAIGDYELGRIAAAAPGLAPDRMAALLRELAAERVFTSLTLDLSPTPMGRVIVNAVVGERFTRPYVAAVGRVAIELQALKRDFPELRLTVVAPEGLKPYIDKVLGDHSEFQHPPFTAGDVVSMLLAGYKDHIKDPEAVRLARAELESVVTVRPTVAISSTTWLLDRLIDRGAVLASDQQMWYQEDFDAAMRGMLQAAGLPAAQVAASTLVDRLLAGFRRELPRRDEGAP